MGLIFIEGQESDRPLQRTMDESTLRATLPCHQPQTTRKEGPAVHSLLPSELFIYIENISNSLEVAFSFKLPAV